jgi:hypothetical protein
MSFLRMPFLRAGLCLGLGAAFAFLWSCDATDHGGEPALLTVRVDSSAMRFSRLTVELQDSLGALDVLFDDSLRSPGQLSRLATENYHGGKTVIHITGYQDGLMVFAESRTFDAANPEATRRDTLLDRAAPITSFAWSPRETFMGLTDTSRILTLSVLPLKADNRMDLSMTDTSVLTFTALGRDAAGHRFRILARKAGRTWIKAASLTQPGFFDSVSVQITAVAATVPKPVNRTPLWSLASAPTWRWSSGAIKTLGFFRVRLDNDTLSGGVTVGDTTYTAPGPLPDGPHTLYVQERDSAGLFSPPSPMTLTVDTESPKPPNVANDSLSANADPRPGWNWTSGGGGNGTYRAKIDAEDLEAGAAAPTNRKFVSPDSLSPGFHVLRVQERDEAGNWSPSGAAAVEVLPPDTTPPNPPGFVPFLFGDNSNFAVKWKSGGPDGAGAYRYVVDKPDFTAAIQTMDSTYAPGSELDTSTSPHVFLVQEKDAKGNWSESGRLEFRAARFRFIRSKAGASDRVLTLDEDNQGLHLTSPIRSPKNEIEAAFQRRQLWVFSRNHRPLGGYEIFSAFRNRFLKRPVEDAPISLGVSDFLKEDANYLWGVDSVAMLGDRAPINWTPISALGTTLRISVGGGALDGSNPILLKGPAASATTETWVSETLKEVWFLSD